MNREEHKYLGMTISRKTSRQQARQRQEKEKNRYREKVREGKLRAIYMI